MVKVHYSSLRPFTYINVRGTYAYTTSDKLTCEYMSVCIKDAVMVLSLAEIVECFTHLRNSMFECLFDRLSFTIKSSKADIEKIPATVEYSKLMLLLKSVLSNYVCNCMINSANGHNGNLTLTMTRALVTCLHSFKLQYKVLILPFEWII